MNDFLNWLKLEMAPLTDFSQESPTPASDEVKRTGLQPQVDAQNINTKSKSEQDKIGAIDGQLERITNMLSSISEEQYPKLSQFKNLWDELTQSWEQIKFSDENGEDDGLGSHKPNQKLIDDMKQNQPLPRDETPQGPGTFGMS
jgi:hypothetical protein